MNSYTDIQIAAWLRGLLAIAWADGDFSQAERAAIVELTQTELNTDLDLGNFTTIDPHQLAASFGNDPHIAENFLRTAMMVALADGTYSPPEAQILRQFHQALNIDTQILDTLATTIGENQELERAPTDRDPLLPVRQWLDGLEIDDPRMARLLCKFIPSQCPFERDIVLFGRKIVHIPPLCKLNPLFDQTVGLRFRALSYLADQCGEDVSAYI